MLREQRGATKAGHRRQKKCDNCRMNTQRHSRRSIRLKGYDYSQPGGYFLTLVTFQREHLFGKITDGEMHLNEAGRIVLEFWEKLSERYPGVVLDEMIIMPNHLHGIVFITDDAPEPVGAVPVRAVPVPVRAIHELPLQEQELRGYETPEEYRIRRRRMLLPKLVGYFKMNTAKAINILLNSSGVPVWQRNYYEHIIGTEDELARIRNYIYDNPQQWGQDDENR
jgi:putative transposase